MRTRAVAPAPKEGEDPDALYRQRGKHPVGMLLARGWTKGAALDSDGWSLEPPDTAASSRNWMLRFAIFNVRYAREQAAGYLPDMVVSHGWSGRCSGQTMIDVWRRREGRALAAVRELLKRRRRRFGPRAVQLVLDDGWVARRRSYPSGWVARRDISLAQASPVEEALVQLVETLEKAEQAAGELVSATQELAEVAGFGSETWGSPEKILSRARRVMGRIDLDPCSSAEHNRFVRALDYFTEEDNGLRREWFGRVFVNPVGGWCTEEGIPVRGRKPRPGVDVSAAALWWHKLAHEFKEGRVEEAVFLMFDISLLQVAQKRMPYEGALLPTDFQICFPRERVAFRHPVTGREVRGTKFTSAVVYLSPRGVGGTALARMRDFRDVFGELGAVK